MDTELQTTLDKWQHHIDTVPGRLRTLGDDVLMQKPSAGKWSRLEIFCHLIDSAANNWQRFVRIQFEDSPQIAYDQHGWLENSYYTKLDKEVTINLWQVINRQLLHIAHNIPADKLGRTSTAKGPELLTLRFLIIDYIAHMEHHLRQIMDTKQLKP